MSGPDLVAQSLAGDRRALSRLLSRIEQGGPAGAVLLDALMPHTGRAHVVGLTGAPGAGKSTLAGALAREWRARGSSVAVVAVDPSSPISGGALLGDRIRLGDLHSDPGVYVRSLASRGGAGGLAEATAGSVVALDAAGFDRVLIETVGAGQSEVAVAGEAHTAVVVLAPGLGDDIQALKAGLLEVADVLVVNKADREGADRVVADLRFATAHRPRAAGATRSVGTGGMTSVAGQGAPTAPPATGERMLWTVPVLSTTALSGQGVTGLVEVIESHRQWLEASGTLEVWAGHDAEQRILRQVVRQMILEVEHAARQDGRLSAMAALVAARRLSPQSAARQVLDAIRPTLATPQSLPNQPEQGGPDR